MIPRAVLMMMTSFCVKVITKESTQLSAFVATGSRHAVLNHRQSFSSFPTPSIPTIAIAGALSTLSATSIIQSGRMLCVSR